MLMLIGAHSIASRGSMDSSKPLSSHKNKKCVSALWACMFMPNHATPYTTN